MLCEIDGLICSLFTCQLQTILDNINGDQVPGRRVQQALQEKLAHEAATDQGDSLSRPQVCLVDAGHCACDRLNDPEFVGEVRSGDGVDAFAGQVTHGGEAAAGYPVSFLEAGHSGTDFRHEADAFVSGRGHWDHFRAQLGGHDVPGTDSAGPA